jgi:hypothetical protein
VCATVAEEHVCATAGARRSRTHVLVGTGAEWVTILQHSGAPERSFPSSSHLSLASASTPCQYALHVISSEVQLRNENLEYSTTLLYVKQLELVLNVRTSFHFVSSETDGNFT